MQEIRGSLEGDGLRVAVVVSRYNESITRGLLAGALAVLDECHVHTDDVTVVHVPGALELPLMCSLMAGSGEFDAVVALGAVIRGETDHYEHVCREAARGCTLASIDYAVPVTFGVLTCDTLAQARDRSTTPAKHKGAEAARSAIETANVVRYWDAMAPEDEGDERYDEEDDDEGGGADGDDAEGEDGDEDRP